MTPASQLVATTRVSHLFVEVAGARLHLLDFGGSGRPVILLHGVLGQAWMWHDVAPGLTAAGRVLALDLRGYGDSQWADGGYSTDGHADDVEAVLEALGAEEADLVGFSWGGLVALAIAARRPELVRRLAMIDIPPSSKQSETELPPLIGEYAGHPEAVEAERKLSPRADEPVLATMAAFGTRAAPGAGSRASTTRSSSSAGRSAATTAGTSSARSAHRCCWCTPCRATCCPAAMRSACARRHTTPRWSRSTTAAI